MEILVLAGLVVSPFVLMPLAHVVAMRNQSAADRRSASQEHPDELSHRWNPEEHGRMTKPSD